MKPSQLVQILLFSIVCLLPGVSSAQSNILVFGDSLSAGYGIPREAAWPNLLQVELQRTHSHYKVINASIVGETSSGGLRRLAAALKEHKPGIIVLELGANDGLRGTKLDLTENNLNTMIRQAKAVGAKVLLVGMQLPPNYGIEYTRRFKSLYPKLALQHRIGLLPFLLQGIEGDHFQADNLHPTAQAQPIIMENVLQKLKPML